MNRNCFFVRLFVTGVMILIAFFTAILPVFGQTYNAHDVDKLVSFLKQPSYDPELTNAQALGIANDIDTFDDWETVAGLTWTDDETNRQLKQITWGDVTMGNLGGHLDLSGCQALEKIKYSNWFIMVWNPPYQPDTVNIRSVCSVDVSGCQKLTSLIMSGLQLKSLNISSCPSLDGLECAANLLRQINLSGCPALSFLNCQMNLLSSLDLSGIDQLTHLNCSDNQLPALDLSPCPSLTFLNCARNRMSISTLPVITNEMEYLYATQYPAWPATDAVGIHDTISVLQKERKVVDADGKEYFTEYNWFLSMNDSELEEGTDYIDNGDGSFTLTGSSNIRNQRIYCLMTNPAFPAFDKHPVFGWSDALRYEVLVDNNITGMATACSSDVVHIYAAAQRLTVQTAADNPIREISVYDITGRLIAIQTNCNRSFATLDLPPSQHLLIVKIRTEKVSRTQKIGNK